MSPRAISIFSLSFVSTASVALWVIDFSATTAPEQANATVTTPSGTIPIQMRLAPRPALASTPAIHAANKSAEAMAPIHVLFDHQGQPSISQPEVRSELPRTIADNATATATTFVARGPSLNDRGPAAYATQFDSDDSTVESLRHSASVPTQFLSMSVNQLEASDPIPKPIVLPAALKEITTETIPSPLTPVQEKAVTRIQDSFVEEIGGEEQAADDANYKQRWLVAQPIADQRLRAQIGDEAFREYQKALVRSAVAKQGNVVP